MPTPKLSNEVKDRIEIELRKGKSHRVIAKELGVSSGAISNVKIERALDVVRASGREREVAGRYESALKEIERLKKEVDVLALMNAHRQRERGVEIKARSGSGKGEATAIICASDWHTEERIERAAVNGVNEFNLGIAKKRIETLWKTAASLVDMCKSRSRIDTVVVNLMGDFISGYLHDELAASNELTPAEAVLLVYDYLIDGLEFLRRETKAKKIIVPCVCGNHGRFTDKRWSKLGPGTNFEYILYAMIGKWFRDHGGKVEIILPQGDMTYLTVYGRVIRVMHGDSIRYAGGIGGIHVPLRKALDAWNTQVRADYNYLGHWHADMTGEDYRVNGSLIGFSEYSARIKARYSKPSQAFGLMHPKYGATAQFPMILE
jgi:transposase